ncbi:MAG TPA: GNAT family N-acetyltransferase [Mucilaginibacter sp.]|jgi:GNAT superfamily N-acetyltransferase
MTLNDEILLRDAEREDMEAITALMDDLGYPIPLSEMKIRLENIFTHPDYRTIVAVLNSEIVGFSGLMKGLSFERSGKYLRIISFVVKKNARNKGIGQQLINASEDWAVELGMDSVVISSGNRNERKAAHIFYQKMGYVIKSSGFFKPL